MPRARKSTPQTIELAAMAWAIETLMARRPGITQRDVAETADMDNKQISRYVCGRIAPNYLNLLRLCEGLDAKPVELMALIEEFKDRDAAGRALGAVSA
jgi:transcriptional regulator with XRE-family HTH domain